MTSNRKHMTLSTGQAFLIPYHNMVEPSPVGWSIWTFTDLDWALLRGLPGTSYMRKYYCEDLEEGQRILAECRGDEFDF